MYYWRLFFQGLYYLHLTIVILTLFFFLNVPFFFSDLALFMYVHTHHLQELYPVVSGLQTLRYSGIAYRTNAVPPPANAHVAVKRTRRS